LELLDPEGLAATAVITVVAGLAHGISGFGFPLVSTPTVTLITDVRIAVMVTLFPNLVVNAAGAFGGGDWRATLRAYWRMPLYVLLGTIVGSQVVLVAPANPLRLLLAAMIVVYLMQDRIKRIDWHALVRKPGAEPLVGLLAGFLSGTVNVMLPPLLIYFTALGVGPAAMTQVLNACFLVGKSTQAATFAAHGQFGVGTFMTVLPLCVLALLGYALGARLAPRVPPVAYKRMIRAVLWALAVLLVAQVAWPR